jgi:hypothetical protein
MRWPLALALCLLQAGQAMAEDPLYPAAQCAAYWFGRDDVARRSSLLDADEGDPARAGAFRAVAVRLSGGDEEVDAFIRRERAAMDRLVRAAIYGDPTSIDLQERLLRTCDAYAVTQDETRGLR